MAQRNTNPSEVLSNIEAHTPDSMHPVLQAAFDYRKPLIIVVCAIIVIAAVYGGVTAYTDSQIRSAQADLGAILVEKPGADQTAKLEALIGQVPAAVKPAVVAAAARVAMSTGAYDKAAGNWATLAKETKGEIQFTARLGQAKALLLAGKAKDALKQMKDLATTANSVYIVPVQRQLAITAEAAGDTATALAAYQKLNKNKIGDKPFIEYKISQLESK